MAIVPKDWTCTYTGCSQPRDVGDVCEFHNFERMKDGGQKFDGDKDEPGLLLSGCNLAVAGVIAVLGFGFRKYKQRGGWKQVPEANRRYKDAMHRHLAAIERGELVDPESGKPHIDHVACNAMFLSQFYHEGKV